MAAFPVVALTVPTSRRAAWEAKDNPRPESERKKQQVKAVLEVNEAILKRPEHRWLEAK
jgi:hypothetical protein